MRIFNDGELRASDEPQWDRHLDFWFGIIYDRHFIPIQYSLHDWQIPWEFDIEVVRALALLFTTRTTIDLRQATQSMQKLFAAWTVFRAQDWRQWADDEIIVDDILPDYVFHAKLINHGPQVFAEIRRREQEVASQ